MLYVLVLSFTVIVALTQQLQEPKQILCELIVLKNLGAFWRQEVMLNN